MAIVNINRVIKFIGHFCRTLLTQIIRKSANNVTPKDPIATTIIFSMINIRVP